jgi:predicted ATPase
VERAQQTQAALTWSPEALRKVASICHRLDGVPLAIELAAARMKVLGIDQLAERLEDRFRLLVGGSRTAQPRQQALRALIDWSYSLLTRMEKTLLHRLSVFAGGWALEAAESVCSDEEMTSHAILPLLEMLIEKSLVVTEELGSGTARYRLLETVRQYSAEKLQEAGEEALVHARHLTYFLQLAEEAEQQLRGSDQARWLNLLETDQDNLRAALEWNPPEREEGRGKREENIPTLSTQHSALSTPYLNPLPSSLFPLPSACVLLRRYPGTGRCAAI